MPENGGHIGQPGQRTAIAPDREQVRLRSGNFLPAHADERRERKNRPLPAQSLCLLANRNEQIQFLRAFHGQATVESPRTLEWVATQGIVAFHPQVHVVLSRLRREH